MPEPTVWIVRGGMEVRAEHNAVVIPVQRGLSEAQTEAHLLTILDRVAPGLAATVRGQWQGQREAAEDEAALRAQYQARLAAGRDPVTNGPLRRETPVRPPRPGRP